MDEEPLAHIPEEDEQAMHANLADAMNEARVLGELHPARVFEILDARVAPQIAAVFDIPALVNNLAMRLADPEGVPEPQQERGLHVPQRPRVPRDGDLPQGLPGQGLGGPVAEPVRFDPPHGLNARLRPEPAQPRPEPAQHRPELAQHHPELAQHPQMRLAAPQFRWIHADRPAVRIGPLPPHNRPVGQELRLQGHNVFPQLPFELEARQPRMDRNNIAFHPARERARRARANNGHVDRPLQPEPEEIQIAELGEPRQPAILAPEQEQEQVRAFMPPLVAQAEEGMHHRVPWAHRRPERRYVEGARDDQAGRVQRLNGWNEGPANEQHVQAPVHQRAPRDLQDHGLRIVDPPHNALPEPHPIPGLELLHRERGCPHQSWNKVNEPYQQCFGCIKILADYILECQACGARRCKKCKQEEARRWRRAAEAQER